MATTESGEFEKALARLEEIVVKLDGDDVELDESVTLFREGKTLARRCEALLKDAQDAVDRAAALENGEPEPRAGATTSRPKATPSGLFDDSIDDDVPF